MSSIVKTIFTFLYKMFGAISSLVLIGLAGYFIYLKATLIHVLIVSIVILLIANIISLYYLIRFMRIILIFEDDLSIALETLKECEESMDNILSLRLFFDSDQVRPIVAAAKDEVAMCRMKLRQMSQRFVERSKQQYIIYEEPIQIEQIRNQPGAIDDELITNRILGFKQELGDDADVYFMTPEEMAQAKRHKGLNS